jgi:hypothetical protein
MVGVLLFHVLNTLDRLRPAWCSCTAHNTLLPRRGLRPLATAGEGIGLVVKGGGQPSAALTVGSRAVGKRKTLI